jgi:predicted chitinase
MGMTVQVGDTLGAIAKRLGTTVEELQRLNGIQDPDRIFAGQMLELPEPGTAQPPQEAGPGGEANAAELFTVDQLAEISQNPDPVAYDLAGDRVALVPEMKRGGIVTKSQITAFLANVCYETDWLKTLEEYGDEAYFRYGKLRRPPSEYLLDEWRYHGRGYIMDTWRSAYERLSYVLGVDLVSNPDLLAKRRDIAARAAVWYWTTNNMGPVADLENFAGVCSLINRGELVPQRQINCWEERLEAYERAKSVIGTGTEPVSEPVTESVNEAARWSWPWANVPPRASGSYQDRHPTRYTWRPEVEKWARYLVNNYDCWVNTYYDHPEHYWRTDDSIDVWGPKGRNHPLNPNLGDRIRNLLFHDKGKPDIDWIIYKRQWWTHRSGVWRDYPPPGVASNSFTWHNDHIHVTYL